VGSKIWFIRYSLKSGPINKVEACYTAVLKRQNNVENLRHSGVLMTNPQHNIVTLLLIASFTILLHM